MRHNGYLTAVSGNTAPSATNQKSEKAVSLRTPRQGRKAVSAGINQLANIVSPYLAWVKRLTAMERCNPAMELCISALRRLAAIVHSSDDWNAYVEA